MAAKIYLEQLPVARKGAPRKYCVVKLVGSVDYAIDSVLSRDEVKDMCSHTGIWEVHISGASDNTKRRVWEQAFGGTANA